MLLKLAPTPEQAQALLDTLHACNEAANYVASVAFAEKTANKFELQKLVYGELRRTAQLAIRCISKASEAYKRDTSIKPTFRPEGAIVYDERIMNFKGMASVSLLTISGRVLLPFRFGAYQQSRLDAIKGQADLLYRNKTFYLAVTLEVATPPEGEVTSILGVDLGIVNLATDTTAASTGPRGCFPTRRDTISRRTACTCHRYRRRSRTSAGSGRRSASSTSPA